MAEYPSDLPDERIAARAAAVVQLRETESKLIGVRDISAAEVVRETVASVVAARVDGHFRPPVPVPDSAFPSDAPEDHLRARRDAISQMRATASKLIDVGDHTAAESIYASTRFVAQPTLPSLHR